MPGGIESNDQLILALQLILGTTFAMSGVSKLRDPRGFARVAVDYHLLGDRTSRSLAWLVIVIECLVAVMFLGGVLVEVAVVTTAIMLVGFAAATAINLRRGRQIACGCFGEGSEPISARTLGRIGLLFLVTSTLAASFVLAGETPVTISDLLADGLDGLALSVAASGLAATALIVGTWLVNPSVLRYVLLQALSGSSGTIGRHTRRVHP